MRLQVTETNIAEGIPHSGSCCPIARALEDRLGLDSRPSVQLHELSVLRGEGREQVRRYYYVPKAAKAFIHRFDRGDVTEPCELTLNIRPLGTRR